MAQDINALFIGTAIVSMRGFGEKFPVAWTASTAYALDDVISTTAGGLFKVTVAGTSGSTAPVEASGTITDGTASLVKIAWRDIGNVSELELTNETEEKEHTDFRGPIPTVDLRVMTKRQASLRIVADERTIENMQIMINGGDISGTVGARTVKGFGAGQWKGQLKTEGQNDQGYKEDWFFGSLTFNPAKSVKIIGGSDFFGGEMEGRVNIDAHGDVYTIETH